ncbi:MAG: hypothetical protein JWQ28_2405 [Pedobacter sp.]|jgi:hypothetical protein|nr:hypothetical protein [Pedobacter sp.]
MRIISKNFLHIGRKANISPVVTLKCLLFFAMLLSSSACKKEPGAFTVFPLETGELTASQAEVVINSSTPSNEALKLSWSAPANSKINYGIIFKSAASVDTVKVTGSSKAFTMGELNNIVVGKLGLEIGKATDITAVVQAFVPVNGKSALSNVITIKITAAPTGAAYSQLYIVGDATPNGWDINNPNEMKVDPTNNFQFKYNAVLNAGEFKIPVAKGSWGADFFMPAVNDPELTDRTVEFVPGGMPDKKWKITTPGAYKILLNISASSFIEIKPFTPYANLYLVGDATIAGWDIDHPLPMQMTAGNPYEFTYTGDLKAGEFKVPTATGSWAADFFMPITNGEGITSTDAVLVPGGNPDFKWKIPGAGRYKITINQLTESISIQRL